MEQLQKSLQYEFRDPALLSTALTHSSFANENRGAGQSNERLEFLGDSILGMTVAEYLYLRFPDLPEGRMTRLRAELVCEQSLFAVAKKLELGRFIRLGRGEERSGGRTRMSILADCVEAVIAALYLDGGTEVARRFIYEEILSGAGADAASHISDYKTALQELVQQKNDQSLEYRILSESGPDHCKSFTAEVSLNGRQLGCGTGRTKKEAEQNAARRALEELRK